MVKNILQQARDLDTSQWRENVFLATVDSTSGNTIKIIRPGESVADNQFYAAVAGLAAAVSATDIVLVLRVGGSFVVVAEVVS